jgi:hypothetical protein
MRPGEDEVRDAVVFTTEDTESTVTGDNRNIHFAFPATTVYRQLPLLQSLWPNDRWPTSGTPRGPMRG